jgi:HEPN domain-containing protein
MGLLQVYCCYGDKLMDEKKVTEYWTENAEEDIRVAEQLYQADSFAHALFFGHLYLEKLLKALIVKQTAAHAPFIHNLEMLAKKSGLEFSEKMLDELVEITEFNIEARYPDDIQKRKIKFTRDFCQEKMSVIKEIGAWLRSKMK